MVHIDIVSDVMCPWCYIGKRRLEKALEIVGSGHGNLRPLAPLPARPDPAERGQGPHRLSGSQVRRSGAG